MLIKSIQRAPTKKPCCSGCREGKPCCGGQPRYEKRGGLWLPDRQPGIMNLRRSISRLALPQWPRDAAFIRQIERIMPVRRVGFRYGDPVKWGRQLQMIKNLLTVPPDQWGGLVRWDLPAYMPMYDMTCTGCCGLACCCADPPPSTLYLTITAAGGSCETCNGGPALMTNQPIDATQLCPFYPPIGSFFYQVFGNFFCACENVDMECSASADSVNILLIPPSGGESGDVTFDIDITSCNPFEASGSRVVPGSQLIDLCFDDGTTGDTITISVDETP